MAFCAFCGTQMSDVATACPNCGHPSETVPGSVSNPEAPVEVGNYAGFWIRFLAILIDGLILAIPSRLLGTAGTGIGFLYQWLMLSFNKGQTVGKMVMGIRITSPNGELINPGKAAVRQAMAIVSGLALGLGYLWAAWDKEHRTWHDSVADTRAYRVPR